VRYDEEPVADDSAIPQLVPDSDDETAAVSDGIAAERLHAPQTLALKPTLRILTGAQAGLTHVMAPGETIIGRGSQCQLQIEDGALSRRHCRIQRTGDMFVIEDLGSRNGTRLAGLAVMSPRPLPDGSLIQLGSGVTIKFSVKDDLELQAEQQLYESSVRDPLTGLHNRRHLDERMRAELAFASRHETALSVLVIDVDHFKKINDTMGHGAGDAALKALAERLHRSVRAEDVVARYGGEEFAVIARGIKPAGALLLAERIRETVARMRVPYEAQSIAFTVSIGVATMDGSRRFSSVEELFKTSDDALYKAKSSGRNRCIQG
jgi:diguanylate cyclase (GGDEF)-like protein